MHRNLIILSLILVTSLLNAQKETTIFGKLIDETGKPVGFASIIQDKTNNGVLSDDNGEFELHITNENKQVAIIFSFMGFKPDTFYVNPSTKSKIEINPTLYPDIKTITEVPIIAREKGTTIRAINIRDLDTGPSTTGSLESSLITKLGWNTRSELSTQYSVRGGSFDENLVYVNDIEVYRPFLIRSGQQEGLSFVNPDMISSIKFSAGGFDARYGDKMSSVLDITYKKPIKFAGGSSMSLLGGSAFVQNNSKNNKFTQVTGIRYKTSQYLLGSLDVKGEYKPSFLDVQTYMTYDLSKKLEVSFLGNLAQNSYNFVPTSRSTDWGTFQEGLNLTIYYEGQERDRFLTSLGALSFNYKPQKNLSLKFISSAFTSIEEVNYDILGQYFINLLDKRLNSKTLGDSLQNIGIGSFLNHARDYLESNVYSIQHIGTLTKNGEIIKWGFDIQKEIIHDKLNEWEMIDSAGFSLPYSTSTVNLWQYVAAQNDLNSTRIKSFYQHTYSFGENSGKFLTLGVRGTYWNYNKQFTVDPRGYFSVEPNWKKDILLSLAIGLYSQPPFYKEMRRPDGQLNQQLKAQKSLHILLGSDYNFFAFTRLFKFTTEVYYKYLYDLVPYKIENVNINYAADNLANGYATGIDFKINGEFVKDAESWMSLSFLRTYEDQHNDSYIDNGNTIDIGPYPRPTDQLMSFNLFFQDYLPLNPSYTVHLNFVYGSRLPLSAPYTDRYDQLFRITAYKRVDVGFSKIIKTSSSYTGNFLDAFKSVIISAEIFNLFAANNIISYLWVKTVSNTGEGNQTYAVPNYLTSRRFNLKLAVKF